MLLCAMVLIGPDIDLYRKTGMHFVQQQRQWIQAILQKDNIQTARKTHLCFQFNFRTDCPCSYL